MNGQVGNKCAFDAKQEASKVQLTFQGHYNESQLDFAVPHSALKDKRCQFEMIYCPFKKQWESVAVMTSGEALPL